MKTEYLTYYLCSLLFTLCSLQSCDIISDTNRTLEMNEIIPMKKVLLLDFTDQACPNCPEAAVIVSTMKESYYGDSIVAVTVHASIRKPPLPLVTEDGNAYDIHFGTRETGHPSGVIDGKLSPNRDNWQKNVEQRFNVFPSIKINISADYNSEKREVKILAQVQGTKQITNTKLLVWIIENNVIDKQLVGSITKPDYEHQHLFRAAVNTTWGEPVEINTEQKTVEHHYTLNEKWKAEDIAIVAFVYNADTDEVYDVNEVKLIQ